MNYEIKLTGVLEREAARLCVLTWLNSLIEVRQDRPDSVTQFFSPEDFGNLFSILELQAQKIRVTIELEKTKAARVTA